jgi:hypothetical protein
LELSEPSTKVPPNAFDLVAPPGAPLPQSINLPVLPLYGSYRPCAVVSRTACIGFTAERQVSRPPENTVLFLLEYLASS